MANLRRGPELKLLGGFLLRAAGETIRVAPSSQRVVAFVALASPFAVRRCRVAGTLWPNNTEERAHANLRSALWRLNQACPSIVHTDDVDLQLQRHVHVDVEEIDKPSIWRGDIDCPTAELLPGWYDDWLLAERERLRQAAAHTVEATCRQMIESGDYANAIDLGLRAVAAEPLRESTRRIVIEALLAEGNVGDAVREYVLFRHLLLAEVGVEPTEAMRSLLPDGVCDSVANADTVTGADGRRVIAPRSAAAMAGSG